MIRGARKRHARIWWILAPLALALMLAAILGREPIEPMDKLPILPDSGSTESQ